MSAEPKGPKSSVEDAETQASASSELSASGTARPAPRKKPAPVVKSSESRPGFTIIEDLDSPYTSPTQVIPVENASYGVGIRHLEEGVDVVFERWETFSVGDIYRFKQEDLVLMQDKVTDNSTTIKRVFLNIPRSTMPLGFVNDVYGEVERVGTTTLSTSPRQVIFVKDTRPGGADDYPNENWHSKLVLTLSDTNIDAVVAARGVTATIRAWEHMRVNDLVMFYWGAHRFELPPITADQVGFDLIFLITGAFIIAAGSGDFVAQFYLFDEVRNRSGELQPWCKPVPVKVNLNIALPPEPFIVEADPKTMVLDADALGQASATAEVEVPRDSPYFRVGDFILLTVHGTTPTGEYVTESLRLPVDKIPKYYEFPIRNELVRSLIQSTLTASYVRQRDGEDDLPSRETTVTVAGRRFELPRPLVRQAHGPFIQPDLPLITAEMPDYQPPGSPGDDLTVRIQGVRLDNTSELVWSSRLAGSHVRTRDFLNDQYARFEGLRDTNVHYIVTGALGVRESDRRWIQVGIPARTLQAPVFQDAINDNVDPARVGSVGTLELRADFKQGDLVILKYKGSVSGEAQYEYPLFVAGNPLLVDVPKQLFVDNLDGTLTASFLIDRYGVFEYSEEAVVTIGTALGKLFMPEVLQANPDTHELDPIHTWPDGATIRVRYEFIKPADKVEAVFKGLPGIGCYSEIKEGQTGDHIDFTVPVGAIGYNIHPDGRDIEVSFKVIRNGFATPSPTLVVRLLSLHHLSGPLIDSIGEDSVLQKTLLDDLDMTRVPPYPYAAMGQRMWLHYSGRLDTGAPYEESTFVAREAAYDDVTFGPSAYTPVGRLRRLQDWSALTIRFWVAFDHSSQKDNAVLFGVRHHVVQDQPNVFPHPSIKDSTPASGPEVSVNPLTVENKCQVLVSYPNMNLGGVDKVLLHWILANGLTIDLGPLDGLDGGTVTYNVPNDLVARSVNSTVHLQYFVQLGRGGEGTSDEQKVTFGTIASANLPRALINGVAHGGSLNPPTLTGDGRIAVAKWRLSSPGQRVWLSVSSPGAVTQNLLTAYPINSLQAANGLRDHLISRAWLLGLRNNSVVTVALAVTFNGSEERSDAIPFPSTQYNIRLTSPLNFDQSAVTLSARTYILPGTPNILPTFGAGNSITRRASGGTAPYYYSSSTSVAVVDGGGLVTVRGNGSATITVRDSSVPAQTRSYTVYVSNVVQVYGMGRNTFRNISTAVANAGLRMPSLDELRAINHAYGARWPMGYAWYWSGTFSHSFLFTNYYYFLDIPSGGTGTEADKLLGGHLNGIGLR
ncbi:hypothetical protein PSH77_17815 [Pseudomonas extremorientalis]|jgi:hypothetical protein|uniref:hypothetical protein n=1 Tax=Pseudomonas extremorientalis TaxID=169669 RepID=UPI002732B520|nr:hypothetical protein [Pseudomonas extremorientalis]WLG54541.1 hypothetical protein PSH77_17815 [Pseudomonas extremorientalis]